MTGSSVMRQYKAIVIGVSAGGMKALMELLPALPENFPLPVIIVQHLHPSQGVFYVKYFNGISAIRVKEADEKEAIRPGHAYFAPPNYHLLVEEDQTFSLSSDEKVNYSRPSIDVLFESAVDVYSADLVGIILTGANHDGAKGLRRIGRNGGLTIVQDPAAAESSLMPLSAIDAAKPDHILSLEDIGTLLVTLGD